MRERQRRRRGRRNTSGNGLRIVLSRCRYSRKGILKRPMVFQIAPLDEFGVDTVFNWVDYDTVGKGQFSRRSGRQLRTLTIQTVAMDWSPDWAVVQRGNDEKPLVKDDFYGSAGGPWKVGRQLQLLARRGSPMKLVVKNPGLYKYHDVDMLVTLRSVTVRERAGEPDARYFDLSFTEYRVPEMVRRQYGAKHDLPAIVEVNQGGVAYEVRSGDEHNIRGKERHKIGTKDKPATLRMLSKHYYGTPSKWRLIKKRNANKMKGVGGDTPLILLFGQGGSQGMQRYRNSGSVSPADVRHAKRNPWRLFIPEADWQPKSYGNGVNRGPGSGGVRP